MSDTVVEARWAGALRFEAVGRGGVPVTVDSGGDSGPSPTESLLIGLATCMGVDVVDILTKMRIEPTGLTVRVEGDRRSEPPRWFTAIRLTYEVEGVPESEASKLQRAVDLSRDKYCSVLHTLRPDIDLTIGIESG
ncbi:MAG: OsmC family protein [Longimicrobiales bacterium]|nr:OsmC family protein [Longimicrobiales bacterium]